VIEDELVFKVVENLGNHDGEILALCGNLLIARAAWVRPALFCRHRIRAEFGVAGSSRHDTSPNGSWAARSAALFLSCLVVTQSRPRIRFHGWPLSDSPARHGLSGGQLWGRQRRGLNRPCSSGTAARYPQTSSIWSEALCQAFGG